MSKKPFLFTLFFLAPPVVAWCQSAENPQKPSTYVVKKGDCLWNISKRVWGDPTKWPILFATNEAHIKNPNLIYPGQKFTIPTTITKEELRKATELAQERAVPLPAMVSNAEGKTLKTIKKQQTTSTPKEPAASSSASKLSPSGTENKENAVSPTTPAEGTTESTGGSGKIVALIAALLALGGGLFVWYRRRNSGMMAQQPRPLSSFPQAAEPPISRPATTTPPAVSPAPSLASLTKPPVSTPPTPATPAPAQPVSTTPHLSTGPQAGGQGLVVPSQGAEVSGGTKPGSAPPAARTGEFTGTITSISMSQPPTPSKAEPGTPTTPSGATAPAVPSASEEKPADKPSEPPVGTP